MKLQCFIFFALLISALALPVPDEEVSPVKPALPIEKQPELKQNVKEKSLEEVKTEILTTEQPETEIKLTEKLALPETVPDAEIAQAIPAKKEEKLSIEKLTHSEDKVSGVVKSLPGIETPVSGIKTESQIVDEVKPAVQEVQPIGKNTVLAADAPEAAALLVSEQKKEELSAIETAPAVKSEIPPTAQSEAAEIPAPVIEEKKEEQPARQERGTEEKVKPAVAEITDKSVVDAPETPTNSEIQPEVKTLAAVEAQPVETKTQETPELKSTELYPKKPLESAQSAGDIPTPQSAEENKFKSVQTEAEKTTSVLAASATPEAKKIEEQAIAKPLETLPEKPIAASPILPPESVEPLNILEEKPATPFEEKKPKESKESNESSESSESKESDSKESEESKGNKSD